MEELPLHRNKINELLRMLDNDCKLRDLFKRGTGSDIIAFLITIGWTLEDVKNILADNEMHFASSQDQRIFWFP